MKTRDTPRQDEHPMPPSRHTPGMLALHERQKANLWRNICCAVCLMALLFSWLIVRAGRAGERIFVMDPAGNIHAGPVVLLSGSREFFNTSALFAANAALQRSPAGFDLVELLPLYFSPRALQKLEDDLASRRDDIQQRRLQQKPIIEQIAAPVVAANARLVEVRGRIISAGAYANKSFYDEPGFVLVLTFIRNPDLTKAGAYPWICDDFEIKLRESPRRS